MKTYIKIIPAVLALILMGSCQDYNQLVKNPNLPLTSPPSLILTGVLNSMNDDNAWQGFSGSMQVNQFWISTYTYYGTNNYDQGPFIGGSFNYYSTLQNVLQMEAEATKAGAPDPNPYSALGKFFRAYYYNLMSQKYGDLPQTDALKGAANIAPIYDSQQAIYVQILKWLDEANSDLATMIANPGAVSLPLAGDIFLNNDMAQWQKVVNAFTLRVLVSLSKKSGDATLGVPAKFAAILGDPAKYPLLTGVGDNLQYTFNAQFNIYPKNPGNIGFNISRENVASPFLKLTTSLKDPRTFVTSTPAPTQVTNTIVKIISGGTTTATVTTKPAHPYTGGETIVITTTPAFAATAYNTSATILTVPTDSTFTYSFAGGEADIPRNEAGVGNAGKNIGDFSAYLGASPGDDMSVLGTNAQNGNYSFVNPLRYYATYDGSKAEPAMIIGYPEMCFNIAEGINRGWGGSGADTWYYNGIQASFDFLGVVDGGSITVSDFHQTPYGSVPVDLTAYFLQPSIVYQVGAPGLDQILKQKYLAFWQNSNWEAFFNQRRTGVPVFETGVGTGNGGLIPQRWQYPYAEATANGDNYKAAVQRQFTGNDNLNGVLWIVQ